LICGKNLIILPYLSRNVAVYTTAYAWYNSGMNKVLGRVRGFTLIELIVVIAVIGVLATITVIGFGRFQADTRDARRVSSATVIAEALEKYYEQNGEYPSCATMTDGDATTLISTTLKGVDPSVLVTPQLSSGDSNAIDVCTDISASISTDSIAYVGDGSEACQTSGGCLSFTLQYKNEATGTIQTITSRRQAAIATSGAVTNLAATPFSFSRVDLTWAAISGAASYNVQYSTNSTFTSPTALPTNPTTSNVSVTGLTLGTQYYFRVQPVATGGTASSWSNTATATTYTLDTPVGVATTNSVSQITYSWGAVANATSYTIEYSNNSSFLTSPSPNFSTEVSSTASPRVFSGLSTGTTLYFRIKSVASGFTSGWSSTTSATTTITAPPAYNIVETGRAWNTLTARSDAVCPAGTVGDYQWYANGSAWVSGTTHQSVTYTVTWDQNVTLTVSTRCTVNGAYSSYTAGTNSLSHTTLDNPTASASNCAYRTACWNGSCPLYTTSSYIRWWVNSSSQGQPWVASNTGVGSGSWAATGSSWGDGNVRSTTYCTGPWGTRTAGGWGVFGSGCVPTIQSGWCNV
jgi:prepilin-type N-terminal cleavage/methylation domain-containing protein